MASKSKSSRSSAASTNRPKNFSRKRNAQRHAAPFYGDILGIAGSLLRSRQEGGADKIGSLAKAAQSFAAELPDVPHIQAYVTATANQMTQLADYISGNSLETMVEDGTALAKRHPVTTLVFAIAAGYGFTRMVAAQVPRSVNNRNRSARGSKSSTSRSASSKRAKANGRDRSHESANAP
jgi:hypothetical protein